MDVFTTEAARKAYEAWKAEQEDGEDVSEDAYIEWLLEQD